MNDSLLIPALHLEYDQGSALEPSEGPQDHQAADGGGLREHKTQGRTRAWRRHHMRRLDKKRSDYLVADFGSGRLTQREARLRKFSIRNPSACACAYCVNPRNIGKASLSEQSWNALWSDRQVLADLAPEPSGANAQTQ